MLLEGDFTLLFQDQEAYLERHGLRPIPEEARRTVQQTLQASVLWTSFQPNGTTTAWSLLLTDRQWRIFAAADAGSEECVIRWSPFEAEHRKMEMLFNCQSQKPREKLHSSVFEPSVSSYPALVREFFEQSQQAEGTLFSSPHTGEAQLLVALADQDTEWWQHLLSLPPEQLVPAEEFGTKRPIGKPQRWVYRCGCDPARLREAVLAAARGNLTAVFGNELTVEIECPRCGREHPLRRP